MAIFKNILKLLIVLQCMDVSWQLTDYEACQVKFNCTKLLTQNDCPVKQFLDPKMTNGCCHGCRGGKCEIYCISFVQQLHIKVIYFSI